MTQDTGGGPGPCARPDHSPRRPGPGSQHIGALAGALSVLDTRLLHDWGQRLAVVLSRGGRLLVAGNGGSAAQAEHLAAQFAGHRAAGRRDCPAIALRAAGPAVTATAADCSRDEEVFGSDRR